MARKSGSSPFSDFGDFIADNLILDPRTGEKRGILQLVDESLGEITGRNLARQQAGEAEERLREEARRREKELQGERQRDFLATVQASQQAERATRVGSRRRRSQGDGVSESLGPERDFLGL